MLAVLGALTANGIITVLKFIGAVMTGSSGMMAESPEAIRGAILAHPNVHGVEELLTMHLAMIFMETARRGEPAAPDVPIPQHIG